jgi:predicted peroxiredoxin
MMVMSAHYERASMKILYVLTSGTSDPTKASLPVHLAVNGSQEVGDQASLLIVGDGTGYLVDGAIDSAEGVGVPPLRDLFAKIGQYEIPVYV